MKQINKLRALMGCVALIALTPAITYAQINAAEDAEASIEQEQQQNTRVTVRVVRNTDNTLDATLGNLTDTALQTGISKMLLNASLSQKELENGRKAIEISFDRASLVDDNTGELKSTPFPIPFGAEIVPNPDIEKNDTFEVEVDPMELIAAWERLNAEKPDVQEEEDDETAAPQLAENPANKSVNSEPEEGTEFTPPDFQVEETTEIVTETLKCGVNIDLAQMAAIVQEETLINGKRQNDCSDSLTRYPIERNYNACPDIKDIEARLGHEQYMLTYNDPEIGSVTVQECEIDPETEYTLSETVVKCPVRLDIDGGKAYPQEQILIDGEQVQECADTDVSYELVKNYENCSLTFDTDAMVAHERYDLSYLDESGINHMVASCTQDDDRSIPLILTQNACGISHDFENDVSYQQERIIYDHKGVTHTLQSCQDGDTTYSHILDVNGCNPIIANNEVTLQNRVLINANGVNQVIRDCEPDLATTTSLSEEVCSTQRYTHDFDNNQSMLNKTFFYFDQNGDRQDVINCQPSDVVFEHIEDTNACSPTHDDTSKQSTLRARKFIEEDGVGKTFISSCEDVDPKIDYVLLGNEWTVASTTTSNLRITGKDAGSGRIGWNSTSGTSSNVPYYNTSNYIENLHDRKPHASGGYSWGVKQHPPAYTGNPRWVNFDGSDFDSRYDGKYCLLSELREPWVTTSGISLDMSLSNESPSWTYTSVNKNASWIYEFKCTVPVCTVTELHSIPVYTRIDGSMFKDQSVTVSVKHICGDGDGIVGSYE